MRYEDTQWVPSNDHTTTHSHSTTALNLRVCVCVFVCVSVCALTSRAGLFREALHALTMCAVCPEQWHASLPPRPSLSSPAAAEEEDTGCVLGSHRAEWLPAPHLLLCPLLHVRLQSGVHGELVSR